MTKVINRRNSHEHAVDIGRKRTKFHWGNPASHLDKDTLATIKVKTREDAVTYFRDWIDGKYPNVEPERREWILSNLHLLKNKTLACWCKPLACHGDILAEMADKL